MQDIKHNFCGLDLMNDAVGLLSPLVSHKYIVTLRIRDSVSLVTHAWSWEIFVLQQVTVKSLLSTTTTTTTWSTEHTLLLLLHNYVR
jgi:hypothetical protein